MSSQATDEVGPNAVMCYFPWFPYYQRYQIGFDIHLPVDPQADPSVAQRLIHVRLYFPDGFICNPANFGGMPDPASFRGEFLPPHPHFPPPMYPAHMYTNPHFHHHVPMGFPGPMMGQEQHDARVVVYVVNGQPGEFMVIDDTPYDVIPQCEECNEFHEDPRHIHNKPSQDVPNCEPSQQLPGHSRQHPSASETVGQRNTSYAARRTDREYVATDHKSNMQEMAGEHQHGTHEAVTSDSNEPLSIIILQIHRLDLGGQNNDRNVAQDNNNPDADPEVEMAQDNKKPNTDPNVDKDN